MLSLERCKSGRTLKRLKNHGSMHILVSKNRLRYRRERAPTSSLYDESSRARLRSRFCHYQMWCGSKTDRNEHIKRFTRFSGVEFCRTMAPGLISRCSECVSRPRCGPSTIMGASICGEEKNYFGAKVVILPLKLN